MRAVIENAPIEQLTDAQVRALAQQLLATVSTQEVQLRHKQATIDKLTHEMAVLKRLKFAAKSEAFNAEQKSLLEEAIDADLEALSTAAEQARAAASLPSVAPKEQPKRQPLPANLPRREIRHEPDSTQCRCGCAMKRIGEDVAEKLDYVPGIFTVERHVRGKWVCAACQTLVQAPVPAHIIDKGLPTTGLLAQGFKVTLEIVDKPLDELLERPKTPRAFADRDRECYYVTTDCGSSDDERTGAKPPEPDIPVDAHHKILSLKTNLAIYKKRFSVCTYGRATVYVLSGR